MEAGLLELILGSRGMLDRLRVIQCATNAEADAIGGLFDAVLCR